MPQFDHVVIVSDNIRGHYHQSLGVAEWIGRLGNADVEEPIKLPDISSLQKIFGLKIKGRKIPAQDADYSKNWLKSFGFSTENIKPGTLFISAGSNAAPFCLAFAKATCNKSAVIMTPSIFGTKPFDYAIVPEHDAHDPNDKKIITTLGAPNHIYETLTKKAAESFFANRTFNKKVVAVLVGGNDANYQLTEKWAKEVLGDLKRFPEITILITTSRRTDEYVEQAVEDMFLSFPSTGYLLILRRNPKVNAVTSILGAATHVLATEDSVSMVSEAITAGFKVGLLRVPKSSGKLKKTFGYGTQRFDEMFEKMRKRELLEDLGAIPDFDKFLAPDEQKHGKDFNEAKRAAEWILNSK